MKRILGIIIAAMLLCSFAYAEDQEAWIFCNPASYVIFRAGPDKGRLEVGWATCGTRVLTDGTTKKGYLKVHDIAAEFSSGWVSTTYITYDEPIEVNEEMVVYSKTRVAARKSPGGKIIKWLKPYEKVFVFWAGIEWSITDKGYVKSELLGRNEEEYLEGWESD